MKSFFFNVQLTCSYTFYLQSKFTVIVGESATGKSAFLRQLNAVANWKRLYPWLVVLDYQAGKEVHNLILSTLTPNNVLVLDEDSIKSLRRDNMLSKLNKLNCYVLLFAHDGLFDLMYSYQDVYEFVTDDGIVGLRHAFPDYTTLPVVAEYYTEDSGSGYEYYNEYLSGNVTPAEDNIHFSDCVDRGTIIADGAILGPQVTQWFYDGTSFSLFAPISFEYLVERHFDNYYKGNFIDRVPLSVKSLERFFTTLVKQRFPEYKKSHCLKEILDVDLLADFREVEDTVFKQYCTKYGITNIDAERERLSKIYGTTDFDNYLKNDFGL